MRATALMIIAAAFMAFPMSALAYETEAPDGLKFADPPDAQHDITVEMIYWLGASKNDQTKYTDHSFWGGLLNFTRDLEVDESKYTSIVKMDFKLSERSHITAWSWQLTKDGEAVSPRKIGFDDLVAYSGDKINYHFDYTLAHAEYHYDWLHPDWKLLDRFSLIAGIEYCGLGGRLENVSHGEDDAMAYGNVSPFLGFGLHGNAASNLTYELTFTGFVFKWESPTEATSYHIVVSDTILRFNYDIGHWNANAGYYFFSYVVGNDMDLEQEKEFHISSGGPFLSVSYSF